MYYMPHFLFIYPDRFKNIAPYEVLKINNLELVNIKWVLMYYYTYYTYDLAVFGVTRTWTGVGLLTIRKWDKRAQQTDFEE